ncbi:FkbM family methyltransferase [Lichenicoccus sp.]|uniref:FkbM family methyltransferase n=1 Tax=Lichenicoccus sp. TaxID=2781899 RepID=UPI003D0BFAED
MIVPQHPWTLDFPAEASPADIYYCFRLLLGRNPNPEEWTGHSQMAGQALPGVVASYLGSLEFSRRGLLAIGGPGDILLAELEGFRIYCDVSDPAVGRHIPGGGYEPEIAALFRQILRPGMGVIDIGANMGFFTMLSASLVGDAGYVLAVEPNARNAGLLECSRQLNGFAQVQVAQVAAGPATGLLALHSAQSTGTASEVPAGLEAMLSARTVPSLSLDCLIPPERRIDFIKVDVDGGEYTALLGCRQTIARDRPLIVSEFSPGAMPGISCVDGEAYLRWLGGFGYEVSVIEPDGTLTPMQQRWADVLAAHRARGIDHIDILATPA